MDMAFVKGFGVGAGLIVAIGAQNAFVLSQGIRRNHVIVIPLICSVCDAILITCGICGVGSLVASTPGLAKITAWGGALFLFWYGLNALRSAMKPGSLQASDPVSGTLTATVTATLGLTLLNPHVYLDTMVLIGTIGSQFAGEERRLFAMGAILASFVWFFGLSMGGRVLAPLFQRPVSWRILDSLVGITMWTIATSLVAQTLS
ncbi:MAG: amino acid transporter [Desulfobacteraceae bacterium]|nr:amino acid transporter [Desulfobacteraceae bacterium]